MQDHQQMVERFRQAAAQTPDEEARAVFQINAQRAEHLAKIQQARQQQQNP